ncbi:MAG: 2OG-Fe(II) oxygenase [Solirubrobacterales bacterium]|nr:2OG-Fe(II) oxygenase [Solirubrobacterales bacterium]MBV9363411.1 2OG-Fe(II) oxygenase [Solirubrobacterales bacterium]MBV9684788.1 2OG-Fe(II) oxygenase [Solirubrobacterales bacterium]
MKRFHWTSFDVRSLLPATWESEIRELARTRRREKDLVPTSVTSRESATVEKVPVMTVAGLIVKEELRWLYALYHGVFRDLAQDCSAEPVTTARDDRYGVVLNVQEGPAMRYECHVDSNPIEGLLYCTTHAPGDGGELVVANSTEANDVDSVEDDGSVVYPIAGNLIFFDARDFAHYVRRLVNEDALRIVAAMNFYTPSSPEVHRPPDLNRHLFGAD